MLGVSGVRAELGEAKEMLKQGQHAQAAEHLRKLRDQNPNNPWLLYDIAVASYAAKDYEEADGIWQQLATQQLPEKLRDKVWFQIGNVHYRFG